MHRAALTARCPTRSQAATDFPLSSSPTGTQHGSSWYRIPSSVWPVWVSSPSCVPSWLLVKINPVLAESRTTTDPIFAAQGSSPLICSWENTCVLFCFTFFHLHLSIETKFKYINIFFWYWYVWAEIMTGLVDEGRAADNFLLELQ